MTASRDRPVYVPYADGTHRLTVGLRPLDPDAWIEPDENYAAELAEKERLLATRRAEVFQALPGSEAAQREVLEMLAAHLPRRFPERFRRDGGRLLSLADGRAVDLAEDGRPPLETAGRLVQEDLCLMRAADDGFRLVAASLCFPAYWSLADKMGRALPAIHGPVPGYDARLAGPVDKVFALLRADRPMWRLNWSIAESPELFQPAPQRPTQRAVTPQTVGERLFVRVERQTLRRLPASGDILFTIRTYLDPVAALAAHPAMARALRSALGQLDPAMRAYKGTVRFHDILCDYLARIGGAAETPDPPSAPITVGETLR